MVNVDERKTADTGAGPDAASSARSGGFTPEQQEKVQELIDGAYKKAYAKALSTRGNDEVERLRGEIDRLKEHKLAAGVLGVVAKYNVVDADEVASLMRPHLSMAEDGSIVAADPSGANRKVGIEEYVAAWLMKRPHHLRASGSAGAGSSGVRFGDSRSAYDLSDPQAWRTMPREELDRLLKDGVNVQGMHGQTYRFKNVANPFEEARKRKFKSGG
jgi:hypothetical protein